MFFVIINCICLIFMLIHAVFYFNYIIYSGLLIFCCQNVATNIIYKHYFCKTTILQIVIKIIFLDSSNILLLSKHLCVFYTHHFIQYQRLLLQLFVSIILFTISNIHGKQLTHLIKNSDPKFNTREKSFNIDSKNSIFKIQNFFKRTNPFQH